MGKTNAEKHAERLKAKPEVRAQYLLLEIAESLAAQVRKVREERGLNQGQLAQLLGTTQSQVSRYENPLGARCSLSSLARLATALDCNLQITLLPLKTQVCIDEVLQSPDASQGAKTSTDYASAVFKDFSLQQAA